MVIMEILSKRIVVLVTLGRTFYELMLICNVYIPSVLESLFIKTQLQSYSERALRQIL